jgi:hypothetical protein
MFLKLARETSNDRDNFTTKIETNEIHHHIVPRIALLRADEVIE